MQVAVTMQARTIGIADQQEYIKRKAEKLLTYFERVTAIHVTVTFGWRSIRSRNSRGCRAQDIILSQNDHGCDDASPTFDVALHKMEQQIRKYKEKIQNHRRR